MRFYKGTDQSAHSRSLISVFAIRLLEKSVDTPTTCKSFRRVFVAKQPEDMFLSTRPNLTIIRSDCFAYHTLDFMYRKTCVKRLLQKRPKIGFQEQLLLNARQKYWDHYAILLTFIKLPLVIKIFVLSILE